MAAISFLEVNPDPAYLEWLADRFQQEKQPFVQFHAASALLVATKELQNQYLPKVEEVVDRALALLSAQENKENTDRYRILQKAKAELRKRGIE